MNERPTHLDLFSGIGGFSLAFEAEGFRTVGFSEIDEYASAVLRKHWPGVVNYGDARAIPEIECDVITAGFPCQPFSTAGVKRGKADDRFLWPAVLNFIRRTEPAWVLCENVTGIIDVALDEILADLEDANYETQPIIVPACAVGKPHYRDRVWILSHSLRRGAEVGRHVAGVGRLHKQDAGDGVRPLTSEPPILGMDARIPKQLHRPRCRALGNSIVPQVAQVFARAIYQELRR